MKGVAVRSKVWLEVAGEPFLGEGRYRLLRAVERCGSINAAARELGISFRKAWSQLDAMEGRAPFPLLERRTGGRSGGASTLTGEARQLLDDYARLRDGVNAATDRLAADAFTYEGGG